MLTDAIFLQIFWHVRVTRPFLCFRVNQVYMFLSQRNFVTPPRWIFILSPVGFVFTWWVSFSPGGFPYLPGGNLTPRSHPGKFLKIWHFPQWAQRSPPGHWDRVFLLLQVGSFGDGQKAQTSPTLFESEFSRILRGTRFSIFENEDFWKNKRIYYLFCFKRQKVSYLWTEEFI